LLQYFFYGDSLFCCTLNKQAGATICSLPIQSGIKFRQKIQHLLEHFLSQPEDTQLLVNINNALEDFYDILLRPVEHIFKDSEHLLIIPSSVLFNIPFSCLFDGTSYLIEQHLISYLPHVGLLTFASASGAPRSWIGFGDPVDDLKMAKRELLQIARLFPEPQLFTGANAKLENLFGKHADVIHIATYVSPNEESPYAATFDIYGSENVVKLVCSDVVSADIRAKLAVLRCCYTGETRQWFGGEAAAIWTCFLLAGCGAVWASPWEIYEDEEVSRLVVRFYELWKNDRKPLVEALASAQREAIVRGVFPAMWGFPLLIGNI
jgi:CHAT domain-containing protein